jgi:hypothetical protein
MKKVFPGARGEWSLALLAIGSTALAACHSNTATYRPAPRYGSSPPVTSAPGPYQPGPQYPQYPPNYQPPPQYPTYQPPPQYPQGGTTTTPPPPPPPRGGQMSCGKGKCG